MMGAAYVALSALAGAASSVVAALLYACWHRELAAFSQPLPFMLLSLGVMGWLVVHRTPAPPTHSVRRPWEWESRVASHIESAARTMAACRMACTNDQPDEIRAAFHLLAAIFAAATNEGRRGVKGSATTVARSALGTADEGLCKFAEHSASALAAKFEHLVLNISSSARIEPVWCCRSVESVAAALHCIPDATTPDPAPAPDSKAAAAPLLVCVLLLVFPIYCAAAASSAASAAIFALIAAGAPIALLFDGAPTPKSEGKDTEEQAQTRRSLFDLRLMELQSMAEANIPKRHDGVVPAALRSSKTHLTSGKGDNSTRNTVTLNHVANTLQQTSAPGYTDKRGLVEENELCADVPCTMVGGDNTVLARAMPHLRADDGEQLYAEIPPFTMITGDLAVPRGGPARARRSEAVVKAPVPQISTARVDQPKNSQLNQGFDSARGSLAQVLGEIGMLDQCAIMKTLGSALTLSNMPSAEHSPSSSSSVSTFEILSGATATALLEPDTPTPQGACIQSSAPKQPTTPGLTPVIRRGTASCDRESLPDLSQADISQSTCFSLSPGGTAHNMSNMLASPSIMLQDENRYGSKSPPSPRGFRADGMPITAKTISGQNLANAAVIVPVRVQHRPRAFC